MNRLLRFLGNYKTLCWVGIGFIAAVVLKLLQHLALAHVILVIFSFTATIPILKDMWHSIRAGHYGIDLPGIIAAVVSVLLHQYWACIIIIVTLLVNEELKTIVGRQVQDRQRKLLEQIPSVVHVFRKRKLVDIASKDIRVGEEIEIQPGEMVPLDGIILKGNGNFDELNLTGSNKLEYREAGETILCGTTNKEETIIAKVVRTATESQYRQLLRIERGAINSSAPLALRADRYSIMFMLGMYIIALLTWFISRQPLRFLEVIIIVTPAPFILAPLFTLSRYLSIAVKRGIIIKTNLVFEHLADAKTLVFDKTNTLTLSAADIDSVTAFKPYTKSEIETYAASLLQRSHHVFAQALRRLVANEKLKLLKSKHVKDLAGFGAEARLGNREIIVGSLSLLKEQGIKLPPNFKAGASNQPAVYIGINGILVGYITFKESYRPDIATLLDSLARLGHINTVLFSDEDQVVALKLALRLGINEVKTTIEPGDKLLAIEAIKERPVIFVGDGLGDAPVLTAAEVGMAVGVRGSTNAAEAADIIIMQDDLRYVSLAMSIAKQAFSVAKQTIVLAVGVSFVVALILATGKVQPLFGSFLRIGIEIIVLGTIWIRRVPTAPH